MQYLIYAAVDACEEVADLRLNCPLAGKVEVRASLTCARPPNVAWLLSRVGKDYSKLPLLQRGMAFDRLVQAAHRDCDLVPVRFREPIMFDHFQRWQATQADMIGAALQRVQGAAQLNVRWLFTELASHNRSHNRSHNGCANDHVLSTQQRSGTAYLHSRSRASSQIRLLESELANLAGKLRVSLEGCRETHVASVRELPSSISGAAHAVRLAGIECLVERKSIVAAQSQLRECKLLDYLPTLVSEPLPAFAFVGEEFKFSASA